MARQMPGFSQQEKAYLSYMRTCRNMDIILFIFLKIIVPGKFMKTGVHIFKIPGILEVNVPCNDFSFCNAYLAVLKSKKRDVDR